MTVLLSGVNGGVNYPVLGVNADVPPLLLTARLTPGGLHTYLGLILGRGEYTPTRQPLALSLKGGPPP